ncbi:hypothetical protein ABH926_000038 [Catenulispora sp. GP43]|uniref:hypothetical protein n=1 Tax=Catenulispora sp. GP43 TaxID=3156263 RepID=UPI0035164CBD
MSRFKHVLMGSVVVAALVAVPVVPAVAQQTPASHATVTAAAVTPDCAGCWVPGI